MAIMSTIFTIIIKNDIKSTYKDTTVSVLGDYVDVKKGKLYLTSTSLCTPTKNLLTNTKELTLCFKTLDGRETLFKTSVKYLYDIPGDMMELDTQILDLTSDKSYYIHSITFHGGCSKIEKGKYTFNFRSLEAAI